MKKSSTKEKQRLGLLEAVALAYKEGCKYMVEGGLLPRTEEELNYVLDDMFSRHAEAWSRLIDVAGMDAVDAAFYSGAMHQYELMH